MLDFHFCDFLVIMSFLLRIYPDNNLSYNELSGSLFFDDIPLTGGTRQATISHKGFLFSNFAAKLFAQISIKFPQNFSQISTKFQSNFTAKHFAQISVQFAQKLIWLYCLDFTISISNVLSWEMFWFLADQDFKVLGKNNICLWENLSA